MIKICFVCLGNICRSPMAEFIMKDKIRKHHLENDFLITSRATSYEEQGNFMHIGARKKLEEKNIPYTNHHAKRLEKEDYEKYDYFICMENSNVIRASHIFGGDLQKKIYLLMDFTDQKKDIADPWYTENFDVTYRDLDYGCQKLFDYFMKGH